MTKTENLPSIYKVYAVWRDKRAVEKTLNLASFNLIISRPEFKISSFLHF